MVWIVGCNGMLGKEICDILLEQKISYFSSDKEIDITDYNQLKKTALESKPSWIVNCSAYTNVDKAEDDAIAAFQINQMGVGNLATIAQDHDIPIIHFSTDYVFDGLNENPVEESEVPNPIGIYGQSKLAGELKLQKICSKFFVIRTAWLYGKYGKNFVYTMLKLMNEKKELKVVNDQIGTPTWTFDLASLAVKFISENSKEYGIYHFTNNGKCSWYDFAKEIYGLGKEYNLIQNSEVEVTPCTTGEFPTKAKRPKYSVLSKAKIEKVFNFKIPAWESSLRNFMKGVEKSEIT